MLHVALTTVLCLETTFQAPCSSVIRHQALLTQECTDLMLAFLQAVLFAWHLQGTSIGELDTAVHRSDAGSRPDSCR